MDCWQGITRWREALERMVRRLSSGCEHRLPQPSTPFPKRHQPRTIHQPAISAAAREPCLDRDEEGRSSAPHGRSMPQRVTPAHLTRTTVSTALAAERFPNRHPRSLSAGTGTRRAPSTSDRRERWAQGCQQGPPLSRAIHAQGISGHPRTVLRWLPAQGWAPRRDERRPFPEDGEGKPCERWLTP